MNTAAETSAWRHPATWVASLGGLGRVPIAPGTVGSLAGLGLYWLLPLHAGTQLGILAGLTALGVWVSRVSAEAAGEHDPRYVVIDEAAGMLVSCFLLPKTPGLLALAFVAFRVLDIGKWFPMRNLETLPGGWGIMADDVAAGLLTRMVIGIWV